MVKVVFVSMCDVSAVGVLHVNRPLASLVIFFCTSIYSLCFSLYIVNFSLYIIIARHGMYRYNVQ